MNEFLEKVHFRKIDLTPRQIFDEPDRKFSIHKAT